MIKHSLTLFNSDHTKESQRSSTSRARSQANNAVSLGDDTSKPSLQASRAEVAPNDPIYPPFKPPSWKFRSGCDDPGQIAAPLDHRQHPGRKLPAERAAAGGADRWPGTIRRWTGPVAGALTGSRLRSAQNAPQDGAGLRFVRSQ